MKGLSGYLEIAPKSRNHQIMSPSLIIPQSSCDFMIAEFNVWFAGDSSEIRGVLYEPLYL